MNLAKIGSGNAIAVAPDCILLSGLLSWYGVFGIALVRRDHILVVSLLKWLGSGKPGVVSWIGSLFNKFDPSIAGSWSFSNH